VHVGKLHIEQGCDGTFC